MSVGAKYNTVDSGVRGRWSLAIQEEGQCDEYGSGVDLSMQISPKLHAIPGAVRPRTHQSLEQGPPRHWHPDHSRGNRSAGADVLADWRGVICRRVDLAFCRSSRGRQQARILPRRDLLLGWSNLDR